MIKQLYLFPLNLPATFMQMCMLFVPRFSRTQAASICFYGVDAPANTRGVFGDGRPSIVLETPKPDFSRL